jgi:hypothetical protein
MNLLFDDCYFISGLRALFFFKYSNVGVLVDPYCYEKYHRTLITRVASLSKKNYSKNQTKVSFFALTVAQLTKYSDFEECLAKQKNTYLQDH